MLFCSRVPGSLLCCFVLVFQALFNVAKSIYTLNNIYFLQNANLHVLSCPRGGSNVLLSVCGSFICYKIYL